MRILGIETSCDETGAAIIEGATKNFPVKLLSNVLATSLAKHAETGGIIPEEAARQQVISIIPVIRKAIEEAGLDFYNPRIDALAVTYGPGLIGSLLVGVETIKTLGMLWHIPVIPVNHMYGHLYANWIEVSKDGNVSNVSEGVAARPFGTFDTFPTFPAIGLVISGGHTDIVLLKDHGDLTVIGGTRDDAAGECFDKCARLLGYEYPGGPKISFLAKNGEPKRFPLPRPMIDSHDYNFSFSGLKTAFMRLTRENFPLVRTELQDRKGGWQHIPREGHLSSEQRQILYDMCASLEFSITDIVVRKVMKAVEEYGVQSLIISGGVAANQVLMEKFRVLSSRFSVNFFVPQKNLCTDNAAMIASAAFYNDKKESWREVTANPELYY